jgi:hypothetical protein
MQRKMMMMAAGEGDRDREKEREKEKAPAFTGHGHRLDSSPPSPPVAQASSTDSVVELSTYR